MTKILIVDDDDFKINNIKDVLNEVNANYIIDVEKSLNYGLRRIRKETIDIILLDMSMPTFNIKDSKDFDSYGGKSFLQEMNRKKVGIPVVVITQYDLFGEGSSQKTADNLDEEFKKSFSNYKGMVKYSSIQNEWKTSLKESLINLK